jgi:hypothetical protein
MQKIDSCYSPDERIVKEFGGKLKEKYPDINTKQTKDCEKLKPFYEKYPGNGPVKVDKWLHEIGIRRGTRGARSKIDHEFIPTLD